MSEEELPTYNEKVDIRSAGLVVYEAMAGSQAFMGDSAADIREAQRLALQDVSADSGLPQFIAKLGLSGDGQQLLNLMLQPDPARRPGAEALLQHPWIQSSGESSSRREVTVLGTRV